MIRRTASPCAPSSSTALLPRAARVAAVLVVTSMLAACGHAAAEPTRVAAPAAPPLPSAHDAHPDAVVAGPETAADRALAERVESAIARDDELAPRAKEAVTVHCRSGRVLLRGGVPTREEKARVESTAREVAGGANVLSDLALVGDGVAAGGSATQAAALR